MVRPYLGPPFTSVPSSVTGLLGADVTVVLGLYLLFTE